MHVNAFSNNGNGTRRSSELFYRNNSNCSVPDFGIFQVAKVLFMSYKRIILYLTFQKIIQIMKKTLLLLLLLLIPCLALVQEAVRTWRSMDGRPIQASWDSQNDQEEKTVYLLKNGKRYRYPLEKLSNEDQKYVSDSRAKKAQRGADSEMVPDLKEVPGASSQPKTPDEPMDLTKTKYEKMNDHVIIEDYSGKQTAFVIPSQIEGLSVTEIGLSAFGGCTGLTSVTIPDSVKVIWGNAFSGCTGLTDISVSSANPNYKAKEGVLFTKDGKTLVTYPAGFPRKNYTIPNSVKTIGVNAFFGCTSLTSVTIPNSVTEIGDGAFKGCEDLTIIAPRGSYAAKFAKESGFPYRLR